MGGTIAFVRQGIGPGSPDGGCQTRLLIVNVLEKRRLSGAGSHERVDQARSERERHLVTVVRDARAAGVTAEFLVWDGDPGGSIAAGLLAALSAPRPARRAVAAVWLKHLWVLHLPWLVIGPGAILVAALAIVGRAAPGVAPLVLLVAMALGPIWLMLSGLCIVVWGQRRQVDIQVLQLRAPTVHIAMMLCAIATLAAAIVLGFVGGSVAVLGPLTADVMPGEEF